MMLVRTAKSPRQAALRRARDRRYRQRRDASQITVLVEIDDATLAMLIRSLWITEANCDSRRAIGVAISKMLAVSARS